MQRRQEKRESLASYLDLHPHTSDLLTRRRSPSPYHFSYAQMTSDSRLLRCRAMARFQRPDHSSPTHSSLSKARQARVLPQRRHRRFSLYFTHSFVPNFGKWSNAMKSVITNFTSHPHAAQKCSVPHIHALFTWVHRRSTRLCKPCKGFESSWDMACWRCTRRVKNSHLVPLCFCPHEIFQNLGYYTRKEAIAAPRNSKKANCQGVLGPALRVKH